MIIDIIIIIYNVCVLSHVQFFVAPWAVAHQVPPSMEFSRQEYWSGLSFSTPGDLPERDQTLVSCVSCIGRWILYHSHHLGSHNHL